MLQKERKKLKKTSSPIQTTYGEELEYEDVPTMLQNHQLYERFLIGALLSNSSSLERCLKIVKKEDFWNGKYGDVYEEMVKLYEKKEDIEIQKLTAGASISELTQLVVENYNVIDVYPIAIKVKENSLKRQIYTFNEQTIEKVKKNKSIEDIINELKEFYSEISKKSETKVQKNTIKDTMQQLKKEIQNIKERKFVGFPTFSNLDQLVNGLIIPHIWVVGGYPGSGKTFFALQLIEKILKNGAKVILFSTENSNMRNTLRIIGAHTGIEEIKILKNLMTSEERKMIGEVEKYLNEKTLIFYDDIFTTAEISLKVQEHVRKDGVNVIVIDYIQLLNVEEDNYEQMRKVATNIQKIAKENNCAVIAVSQINNEGQKSRDFFRMNFKGAGEIGAIADVAIELVRVKDNFNLLGAVVKKVRHGIPGKVQFKIFSEENKLNKNYIQETL